MRATPFLMFQGDAEAALLLWKRAFPDLLEVTELARHERDDARGKVSMAAFSLGGTTWRLNDSPVPHAFTFTPSTSLFVDFDDEAPLRHAAKVLGERGKIMMPLDDYGFSRLFTWISDEHGVSWQLNLP